MGPQGVGKTARPIGQAALRLARHACEKGDQRASRTALAVSNWDAHSGRYTRLDNAPDNLDAQVRLPKVIGHDFRHHFPRPQMRCIGIGNRVFGNLSLLIARVEERGAVAGDCGAKARQLRRFTGRLCGTDTGHLQSTAVKTASKESGHCSWSHARLELHRIYRDFP